MKEARPHEAIDENSVDVAALRRTPAQARPRRRYRGIVIGGLVAVVLILFVSVVWFAYQDMMPGGDEAPPVVRAEVGPLKRAPDERGGAPVVNEESVVVQALNEPDAPVRVERLIPRDEPAPRSAADVIPDVLQAEPAPPEAAADSLDAMLADLAEGPQELRDIEPGNGDATVAPIDGEQVVGAPKAAPESAAVPVPSPPTAVTATPTESQAPKAPASVPRETNVPAIATPSPATAPAKRTAAPEPTPARTAVPAPVPPPAPEERNVQAAALPAASGELASSFRLQLLAVRDEAAAATAWTDLQRKFPAVLGALRSRIEQAKVGGNTFYRLQAGPFQGRDAADRACRALQQGGSDCFIVGPTS